MPTSDREDGRFIRTSDFLHHYYKNLKPKLALPENLTVEQYFHWQGQVRTKLVELMRFPQFTDVQPEPLQLWEKQREGYVLQKWEIYPEPGCVVPFLMLVPDTATSSHPAPAVLCFPGSHHTKESLAGEPEEFPVEGPNKYFDRNQMAKHYVQQGIVAIAVENPGIGEISGREPSDSRGYFSYDMIPMGRHYLGVSIFQKLAILNWLKGRAEVDANRIAVSGHSLGTGPAMIIGVIDPQVKAVVFNDFLCDNRVRRVVNHSSVRTTSPWSYVPDLLEWFSFPDILAAFAPRATIVTEGGVTADLHKVHRVYELLEQPAQMEYYYYPRYQTPESRKYEFAEIPEGLTSEQFFEYANVDVIEHSFKPNLAVPWLKRVL